MLSAPSQSALSTLPASARGQRVLEFLLLGGVTPLLFPLSYLLRRALGLDDAQLAVGALFFYAAFVINDPHFAVTYVLFYRHARERAVGGTFAPAQRARYWLSGLVLPLLLAGWALAALLSRSAWALGLLFQLMFLLVGLHYVKQGFGILTVLSARRGLSFAPHERRVLLLHCYAGWAYAWASPADRGFVTEQKGLLYSTLAHPAGLEPATQLLFFASVLPLARLLWQRRSAWRLLAVPLLSFLCTVWLWTLYTSIDPLVRYALPALHSLQYLYMVWLLEKNQAREREGAPYFEATVSARLVMLALSAVLLGWLLFHGAPSALDDLLVSRRGQLPLGPTPYFAALFVFVNLHHYLMDMVIWRRDNPLTRYLRHG
jgi:hypothetical protein